MEYSKPWLSLDQQIDRLESRGVDVGGRDYATRLLEAIGYYRLSGYLYPFRESTPYEDAEGRTRVRVLNTYRPGTVLHEVEAIIDFDRRLRMLVMEGIEHIEVAVRMRVGYVLGRSSAFAHRDAANFTETFTSPITDPETGERTPSLHDQWLERVKKQKDNSHEVFIGHFRDKYDDNVPIWVLTEILELGQLSRLYRGMNAASALEVAEAFSVPTKKIMANWLASLNYVRNVSAHHARLFNRKLQYAPTRPKKGRVPVLDHFRDTNDPKRIFGTYNALAVIAYLLQSIDRNSDWRLRIVSRLRDFPMSSGMTIDSLGVPPDWESLEIWM